MNKTLNLFFILTIKTFITSLFFNFEKSFYFNNLRNETQQINFLYFLSYLTFIKLFKNLLN